MWFTMILQRSLVADDFLTNPMLGAGNARRFAAFGGFRSFNPRAAEVGDERTELGLRIGVRANPRGRELPVAAHPEEQRNFTNPHFACHVAHAAAVLGNPSDGLELARGGIARRAHRSPRSRCSEAVMPKRARNALAKLHGLSNPHAAHTSGTGRLVVASSLEACSSRIRAANC